MGRRAIPGITNLSVTISGVANTKLNELMIKHDATASEIIRQAIACLYEKECIRYGKETN